MSRDFLFLHYGPGGNSQVEARMLSTFSDRIDFWDQPKFSSEYSNSYEKLLNSVCEKVLSGNIKNVIAHSFGANLLVDLVMEGRLQLEKVILISPIINFPQSFKSFATKLKLSSDFFSSLELKESLSSSEFDEMFQHVLKIITHAKFSESYWKDLKKFAEYTEISQKVESLDLSIWKSILAQYLAKTRKYNENVKLPISKSKLVILGSQDPYIENILSAKKFWEKLGFQVECLSDIGHYPHLEEAAFFDRVLTTGH